MQRTMHTATRYFAVLSMGLHLSVSATTYADDGAVVFEEDFDDGLARWEMTDPEAWRIVAEDGDRRLELYKASEYRAKVRSPYNIAWVKDIDVGDFVLDVTMRQTGRDYDHRDLCLFFGGVDATHYYYVHLASRADERAHAIFIVNDAPRANIVSERTDGVDWDEEYHRVRVERDAKSGRIAVYFDDMDTPIMEATDTTFPRGRVGVGSFDDVGIFDEVRVTVPKKQP